MEAGAVGWITGAGGPSRSKSYAYFLSLEDDLFYRIGVTAPQFSH
jgi:hypothetical protein